MTVRTIQWIADTGLLVGLTTMGEFGPSPQLAALSLSTVQFTLSVPMSGAILGASAGSVITAGALPGGLTIGPAGWAYDGSGVAGVYPIVLTENLPGAANSPRATGIIVSMAVSRSTLDFSQPANSGGIAAIRSF